MLTRRSVILAKIESTYNTDPTPATSADEVLVENLAWANEGLRMNERPAVRPSLGALQHVYGGRLLAVTFDVEVKGSGTAGAAPEIGALLRACALGETIVAITSVTYAPVSTAHESITLYLYEDGKLIKVTGARGEVAFTLEAGNKVMANFSFKGHVSAQTDVSLPTPSFDSTAPVPYTGGSFAIDSFAGVIGSLSFALGNTVSTPPSVNGSDGYGEVTITGRDVTGSFDPEDELVATEDWIGNFISGASMVLATGAIGSVAGNIINITMPAVYYRDVAPGDRDGIRSFDMSYAAAESTTDDEISIALT